MLLGVDIDADARRSFAANLAGCSWCSDIAALDEEAFDAIILSSFPRPLVFAVLVLLAQRLGEHIAEHLRCSAHLGEPNLVAA